MSYKIHIVSKKTMFDFWPLAPYIDPQSLEGFGHVYFLLCACVSTYDEMKLCIYSTMLEFIQSETNFCPCEWETVNLCVGGN